MPPKLTPYERSLGIIAVRFPVLMIATDLSYCYWLQLLPTGPQSHTLKVHALAPESTLDQLTQADHEQALTFFDAIQTEDAAVNERIQASMRSQYAYGGVFHEQEFPLLHMQRYIAEMLGQAGDERSATRND